MAQLMEWLVCEQHALIHSRGLLGRSQCNWRLLIIHEAVPPPGGSPDALEHPKWTPTIYIYPDLFPLFAVQRRSHSGISSQSGFTRKGNVAGVL